MLRHHVSDDYSRIIDAGEQGDRVPGSVIGEIRGNLELPVLKEKRRQPPAAVVAGQTDGLSRRVHSDGNGERVGTGLHRRQDSVRVEESGAADSFVSAGNGGAVAGNDSVAADSRRHAGLCSGQNSQVGDGEIRERNGGLGVQTTGN